MNMQSENINELAAALAKAQGQMKHASTDSTNPHFKSKYADLASIWEVAREPLSANCLAIVQRPTYMDNELFLETILTHSSGQWIKGVVKLPIQKTGPQEIGSCMTYMRRYGLAAMVGVYQDDDDAEQAQKPFRKADAKPLPPKPVEEPERALLEEECARLDILNLSLNDQAFVANLLGHFKINNLHEMTSKQYGTAIKWFEKKIKEREEGEKDESSGLAQMA